MGQRRGIRGQVVVVEEAVPTGRPEGEAFGFTYGNSNSSDVTLKSPHGSQSYEQREEVTTAESEVPPEAPAQAAAEA